MVGWSVSRAGREGMLLARSFSGHRFSLSISLIFFYLHSLFPPKGTPDNGLAHGAITASSRRQAGRHSGTHTIAHAGGPAHLGRSGRVRPPQWRGGTVTERCPGNTERLSPVSTHDGGTANFPRRPPSPLTPPPPPLSPLPSSPLPLPLLVSPSKLSRPLSPSSLYACFSLHSSPVTLVYAYSHLLIRLSLSLTHLLLLPTLLSCDHLALSRVSPLLPFTVLCISLLISLSLSRSCLFSRADFCTFLIPLCSLLLYFALLLIVI